MNVLQHADPTKAERTAPADPGKAIGPQYAYWRSASIPTSVVLIIESPVLRPIAPQHMST
jgi:hypothetical protein